MSDHFQHVHWLPHPHPIHHDLLLRLLYQISYQPFYINSFSTTCLLNVLYILQIVKLKVSTMVNYPIWSVHSPIPLPLLYIWSHPNSVPIPSSTSATLFFKCTSVSQPQGLCNFCSFCLDTSPQYILKIHFLKAFMSLCKYHLLSKVFSHYSIENCNCQHPVNLPCLALF